jgi:enoyl-[acyl-carrier-protein] reductase (NADH)
MPYTGFIAAGGMPFPADELAAVAQAAGAGHSLGKPITAEVCAEAAFLCSDLAKNVTGVLVPVDGGYVAQ